MPAVTSGKILVTGANGYIAGWVMKIALEQGFAVRGTVRAESKAAHLRSLFQPYGDKFEIVDVEDIAAEGAFDEAVKDVDAIVHTASPVTDKEESDPSKLIVPAVQGTMGILTSVQRHGSSVQRIVVTASIGSVHEFIAEPKVYSEADWNELAVREVETKGVNAVPIYKYCASKTLAERAAWDFWRSCRDKGQAGWDLVVLHPSYVFGPTLQRADRPEQLRTSMGLFYDAVFGRTYDEETLATFGSAWVDVRDVGLAHVLAIKTPDAGGERIIISNEVFKLQDFVDIAHRLYPQLPAGNTEYDPSQAFYLQRFDTSKEKKLLGVNFRSKEETTRDTLEEFKEKGWL